jgi:hypothetical protein
MAGRGDVTVDITTGKVGGPYWAWCGREEDVGWESVVELVEVPGGEALGAVTVR